MSLKFVMEIMVCRYIFGIFLILALELAVNISARYNGVVHVQNATGNREFETLHNEKKLQCCAPFQ